MLQLQATSADVGLRLDHFLQKHLPQFSRSRLKDWIKDGRVLVASRPAKASLQLRGHEGITVEPADPPPLNAFAEDLPVEILYQDPAVIAVDKPSGMVVHAGAGHYSGTLVNALLHRFGGLSTIGGQERPGVVHRLDRYTSGVLLVARNDPAHRALARQFSSRQVRKRYVTLVHGVVKQQHGMIDAPIERDPIHRTRMTCRTGRGRPALTEYTVARRFNAYTYLNVDLHTGRTHQIRVHLASIGHPVVGDPLYGAPRNPALNRYFLHAARTAFVSPASGVEVTVEAQLPPELAGFLATLE
ncbi:MAG: RluA family pseudouridine synthase [Bryobacterales bacterium]|nr:RluA family pseudouridine synthase [Bryobacterales bacterium]